MKWLNEIKCISTLGPSVTIAVSGVGALPEVKAGRGSLPTDFSIYLSYMVIV